MFLRKNISAAVRRRQSAKKQKVSGSSMMDMAEKATSLSELIRELDDPKLFHAANIAWNAKLNYPPVDPRVYPAYVGWMKERLAIPAH